MHNPAGRYWHAESACSCFFKRVAKKIAKREKARPKRKARHHKGVILAKAILVSGLPKPYRKLCSNMKMIYLLCELFIIFPLKYKLQNKIHCGLYFNS